MMLGVAMIATCEVFAGRHAGARPAGDERRGLDLVGAVQVATTYCPVPGVGPNGPADDPYRPGLTADLMLKDFRLSQWAAEVGEADTLTDRFAADLYRRFVEGEDGRGGISLRCCHAFLRPRLRRSGLACNGRAEA